MSDADEYDQGGYVMRLSMEAIKPENIVSGRCFLCGGVATLGKGEHVFPRWLQKRYGLWDQSLTLLNGTHYFYRNLRIPACKDCNTRVLGKTEACVSKMDEKSVSNWSIADSYEIGRWLAKILLGILFKETSLLRDRSSPELGTILCPSVMSEMMLLHLLVQSWRKLILFETIHAKHPFTLYVYEIEEDDEFSRFNFSTNIVGKSLCIRFGSLGFAFVADGGLQHDISELGPYDLAFQRLHPIQFDELAARIHYKSTLRDATHLYVHVEDDTSLRFIQIKVIPYSENKLDNGDGQVFREWSNFELAGAFRVYGFPGWEYLLDENREAVYTLLVDSQGKKLNLSEAISQASREISLD